MSTTDALYCLRAALLGLAVLAGCWLMCRLAQRQIRREIQPVLAENDALAVLLADMVRAWRLGNDLTALRDLMRQAKAWLDSDQRTLPDIDHVRLQTTAASALVQLAATEQVAAELGATVGRVAEQRDRAQRWAAWLEQETRQAVDLVRQVIEDAARDISWADYQLHLLAMQEWCDEVEGRLAARTAAGEVPA